MRRSASEVIRNLESRIARLERQATRNVDLNGLSDIIAKKFSSLNPNETVYSKWWITKVHSNLERFFSKSGPFDFSRSFEVKDLKGYQTFGDRKVVELTLREVDGEEYEMEVNLDWNGQLTIQYR